MLGEFLRMEMAKVSQVNQKTQQKIKAGFCDVMKSSPELAVVALSGQALSKNVKKETYIKTEPQAETPDT